MKKFTRAILLLFTSVSIAVSGLPAVSVSVSAEETASDLYSEYGDILLQLEEEYGPLRVETEGLVTTFGPYADGGDIADPVYRCDGEEIRAYFEQFDWYIPTVQPEEFTKDLFNQVENNNIDALQEMRDKLSE